jgi:hypothetical protein
MLRKFLITTAAAAVLPLSAPTAAWADSQTLTADELMQQVEWLQVQMSTLLQQIEQIKTQSGEASSTANTAAKKADDLEERTAYLEDDVEDLDDRLMGPERHTALDSIRFSGDFRTQAHSISVDMADRIDGINVQKDLVNTLFYFGATGQPPMTPDLSDVDQFIAQNYDSYLYYLDNVVSFDFIKQQVEGLMQQDPALAEQLLGLLASQEDSYIPGYNHDNDIVYTTRLRMNMAADVAEDVVFEGRLGMYKTWGDSTNVQVFNGQPTSIGWDGTTVGVPPSSDLIRLERGYFTWRDIADLPMYLSVGRRPSTGGAPLNFREDEPRGGTPIGALFNYQFDGITWGYHFSEQSTFRICYGLGYESEWGNGSEYKPPSDRLDDTWFVGAVWDVWNTEDMLVQLNVATAQDIGDGFNGLTVLPFDPVTGQDAPPAVIRYTPTDNIGNMNLAGLVLVRHDGPFDWFASVNYSESDPNDVTTPFGGMFADPFETPDDEDGHMYYLGARYNFPNDKTRLGLEFNHGSEYWFNFALAEDDFLGPKTSVRGDVWEVYLTHRIRDKFIFKIDYIDYSYDYSGSGWILGAPKDLGDNGNILATPTYDDASKFMASFTARF